MKTPDFTPREMKLNPDYVNRLLGLSLTTDEIKEYLERMRYGVKAGEGNLLVSVPAYRADILHEMDLVEDIAIAYGYQNFMPEKLSVHTKSHADSVEEESNVLRDLLIGSCFTEVMTLVLSSKTVLFSNMNVPEEPCVEAENPVSSEHGVARSWLTPLLLSVLSKNKTKEFPQRIFEVGDVLLSSGANKTKVAGAVSHPKAGYSEMKSIVEGLLSSLGVSRDAKPLGHGSFIEGRCASIGFGFFGEIHPAVLSNFGLEMPVTAFEFDLEGLFRGD